MPLVDTALATTVAARLAPAGPSLTLTEAADVVVMLRDLTEQAEQHVRDVTGLHGVVGPATVVDRPGWAAANAEGFAVVLAPLEEAFVAKQGRVAATATAKVTALQMGALLAWLSGKVLGQYEAFQPEGQQGRLLLNAPTIVETERRLGVDPHDFRLWVALHEVTHRTQFTAVPWLHAHVRSEVGALLEATKLDDPEALLARVKGLRDLPRTSIVEAFQTPEQKVVMHWRGHSDTMQDRAVYGDVVREVCAELEERLEACTKAGIGQVLVDPGLGFAKKAEHNWALLQALPRLQALGPVLLGASRKRFLGELLDGREPKGRDAATTALTVLAAQAGCWGVRVHDARGSADAVRIVERMR